VARPLTPPHPEGTGPHPTRGRAFGRVSTHDRKIGTLRVIETETPTGWHCQIWADDGREGDASASTRRDAYDGARADLHQPAGESRYTD
jgi:hypothetical protein